MRRKLLVATVVVLAALAGYWLTELDAPPAPAPAHVAPSRAPLGPRAASPSPSPVERAPLAPSPSPSRSVTPPGDFATPAPRGFVEDTTEVPEDRRALRQAIVVLAPDGKPVADALVTIRCGRSTRLRPRRTDARGETSLDASEAGVDAGKLRTVFVRHARFGRQGPFSLDPALAAVELALHPVRTGTLAGTVRAPGGAVPPSPVIVVAALGCETRLTKDDVRWTREGRFEVDLAPAASLAASGRGPPAYSVRARAPGFCPSPWQTVAIAAGARREVELIVERESSLSGVVTLPPDLDGSRGLALSLEVERATGAPGAVETEVRPVSLDDQGVFYVGELRPGWYRLRVSDSQHVGPWASVELRDGESVETFTLHLDPPRDDGSALVRGIVHDEERNPVAGAIVTTLGARATTGDDGRFALRLEAGRHVLECAADGYEPPSTGTGVAVPAAGVVELTLRALDPAGKDRD